jgi:uncharacterized protein YbjT (DUF2867 family)
MRVLVTGAYGLIGSAVLLRLHRDGHELVAAGRAIAVARRRAAFARWVAADYGRLTLAGDWLPLLEDIDAVVNCVGALQDGARDNVHRVHVEATTAMFAACEKIGVRRVIHISMIGAEPNAPTAFARSKAEAEADLAARHLDWTILRPALVLGPGAYGGSAMLRALAAMPLVTPVVAADTKLQVVSAGDLAETVAQCLRPGEPVKTRWDLAHPAVHTLGSVVVALRNWLGFRQRPMWRVPRGLAALVAALGDALGFLGWRSPARSTALRQLTEGKLTGDPEPWIQATGIVPKSLDEALLEHWPTAADRWFAKLYLLKPLLILGIALFWVTTGIITLGSGRAAALAHLKAADIPAWLAERLLVWGAYFDYAIGLLVLFRPLTRVALVLMLAVTPVYLIVGTVLAPQLWLDPLGPFLKIIPVLLVTMAALAVLDER